MIVKKVVVNDNGGTKVARLLLPGERRVATGFEADGQNDLSVNAGTYNVTEPAWRATRRAIELLERRHRPRWHETCTITNDDQAATLIVIKVVVNDNGGTAITGDSNDVDDSGSNPPAFADADSGRGGPGRPGHVLRLRVGPRRVHASTVTGCSGSIALGATRPARSRTTTSRRLVVIKHVVNDNGGTGWRATSRSRSDAARTRPPSRAPRLRARRCRHPGAYYVTETGPAGTREPLGRLRRLHRPRRVEDVQDHERRQGSDADAGQGGRQRQRRHALPTVEPHGCGPTGFSGPGPSVSSDAGFDGARTTCPSRLRL